MSNLREVQMCGLEILKKVVNICEAHHITYYLSSGTLLGAVRHRGFIPWDNDIDIEMPVEDYRKFLKIAPKELGEDYFLQTYFSDNGYNEMWAKVRKNGTTSLPLIWKEHRMHWGIGIDIFPLVGIYKNKILNRLQKKLFCLCRTYISKEITIATQMERISDNRKLMLIYRIPRKTRVALCKFNEKFVFKSFNRSEIVATVFTQLTPQVGKKYYDSHRESMFEDRAFTIPNGYDGILSSLYGDYMMLPPVEERNGHEGSHGKIIYDCDRDYAYYQKELNLQP